jgi:hypothetical protein
MSSNKQKREQLAAKKLRKLQRKQDAETRETSRTIDFEGIARGLAPIDRSKLRSASIMPSWGIPTFRGKYYLDYRFNCKDCGKTEVWTGAQQKWWHEEIGGNIEQIAVRCRDCRMKERLRKEEARHVHMAGIAAKGKNPA